MKDKLNVHVERALLRPEKRRRTFENEKNFSRGNSVCVQCQSTSPPLPATPVSVSLLPWARMCVCVYVKPEAKNFNLGPEWRKNRKKENDNKPMRKHHNISRCRGNGQKRERARAQKKCEKRKLYRLVCVCFSSSLPPQPSMPVLLHSTSFVGLKIGTRVFNAQCSWCTYSLTHTNILPFSQHTECHDSILRVNRYLSS